MASLSELRRIVKIAAARLREAEDRAAVARRQRDLTHPPALPELNAAVDAADLELAGDPTAAPGSPRYLGLRQMHRLAERKLTDKLRAMGRR